MVDVPFPKKKYQVILADPPWSYNDKMNHSDMSASKQYPTQSGQWISNLPVQSISDPDCCLFLWCTSPLLDEVFEVIKSWGFKFKTIAFCWSKYTVNGKLAYNLGRWTMGNIELCLLATKGNTSFWRKNNNVKQLVQDIRYGHSVKPGEVRHRIVDLLGNRSRIELFAREKVDGWDSWGNDFCNAEISEEDAWIESLILKPKKD